MEEFAFTISSGQVTGMAAVFGTHTHTLNLPKGATFVVGAGTVTETLTLGHGSVTEVANFTQDTVNPANYDLTSVTDTVANPQTTTNGFTAGFAFTISNGAVTQVQTVTGHGAHTFTHTLPNAPGVAFAVSGAAIVETQVFGNVVDTATFVQPSGSSLWAVSSETETFIPTNGSTTALNVSPCVQDVFTIANGVVTQAQSLDPHGGLHTLTLNANNSFTVLSGGLVEEVSTVHGHTCYEIFANPSGVGSTYTLVASGSGSTPDITGLQAQLAQLQSLAGTLI